MKLPEGSICWLGNAYCFTSDPMRAFPYIFSVAPLSTGWSTHCQIRWFLPNCNRRISQSLLCDRCDVWFPGAGMQGQRGTCPPPPGTSSGRNGSCPWGNQRSISGSSSATIQTLSCLMSPVFMCCVAFNVRSDTVLSELQ